MGKATSLVERVRISEMVNAGYKNKEIAAEVGWSIATVKKWRRRVVAKGRAGLASVMGRPVKGALSTFAEAIPAHLKQWREVHPGWGPDVLVDQMQNDEAVCLLKQPSRSSVGRYLKAQGLTRRYQRHSALPESPSPREQSAHECWEMDARGHEAVPGVGVVALINLNDRFSRTRLLSYPCVVGGQRWLRHPNTEDYQLALRLAFTDWGLPQRLQVDHASVFFDNLSPSPFPTRIHLWLLALGVPLTFSRRAQEQGITERSHQTWWNQVVAEQTFANWSALYHALRHHRERLNQRLPCASLDRQPPLVAHSDAVHSGRTYRPEWEAELLDFNHVWDYLAQGRWFRRLSKDATFSLGNQVYYVGHPWSLLDCEITFDPERLQLVCRNDAGDIFARKPIQGVTASDLMGAFALAFNLPFFQLALPFADEPDYRLRLFETIRVTTL